MHKVISPLTSRRTVSLFCFGVVLLLTLTGCNQWTEHGPKASGRVSAITGTDANHLWAASPGGGVWKSQDGGSNWNWPGNYALGDLTVLDLAKDRTDSNQLFLRAWNGFLVSTDGAASWTQTLYSNNGSDTSFFQSSYACTGLLIDCAGANLDFEPRPFTQMVFPTRRKQERAGSIVFTAMPCQELQYSTNYGASFTQVWPFPSDNPQTNPDNCIASIAADEATGKVYFASMGLSIPGGVGVGPSGTHIFRSTQPWTAAGPPNPLEWEVVNNGIDSFRTAQALVWGGSADKLMAIVTDDNGEDTVPYLFDGTAWTAKPIPGNDPNCFLGTDNSRPLVWGGGNDFFLGGTRFAYTVDAGDTWTCPNFGTQWVDIRSIYADSAHGLVWTGADQSGLGNNSIIVSYPWTPGVGLGPPNGFTGNGISSWQSYSVAVPPKSVSPQHPSRVFTGAQDITTACSDNFGETWQLLNLPGGTAAGDIAAVIWNDDGSGNGDVFYTATNGGAQLFRSTNAGTAATCNDITLTDISPPTQGSPFMGPHLMAVQPNNNGHIFVANYNVVRYSLDAGTHWTFTNFSITSNGITPAVASLFADENGALYIGTQDGGAYICTDAVHYCNGGDGAGTWTPWGLNLGGATTPPRMITSITESNPPTSPRNFWMGTTDGVYRKLADETNWTLVQSTIGPPPYVYNEVVVDPACSTRIYAGVGYLESMSRTRGGIIYSTDNGATWSSITAGFDLHDVPITQIVVDPANDYHVVASTYGRGVWDYFWALPGYGNLPLPTCQ